MAVLLRDISLVLDLFFVSQLAYPVLNGLSQCLTVVREGHGALFSSLKVNQLTSSFKGQPLSTVIGMVQFPREYG